MNNYWVYIQGDGDDTTEESHMMNNTSKLTNAVSSLPELIEMKRVLDMHTNLATGLLDIIKVAI